MRCPQAGQTPTSLGNVAAQSGCAQRSSTNPGAVAKIVVNVRRSKTKASAQTGQVSGASKMRSLQPGHRRTKRVPHSGQIRAPAATGKPHAGQLNDSANPQDGQTSSSSARGRPQPGQ